MAYSLSSARRCLTALAALALAAPLYGAGEVTADVEVFYPVPAGGRSGGVAAMGATKMEAAADSATDKMIRVTGSKDPIGGAWWFPNHLPMTTAEAHVGDKAARLVIEVDAATPTKAAVNVRWRFPDGKSGEDQSSGDVQLKPGTPTRITLP
ncbi:MAG: hypothetical protein JWM57_1212, partial [Phycisphaerales bacterium]|nr:hypothetical protein [Phycisphaerales bacterium]